MKNPILVIIRVEAWCSETMLEDGKSRDETIRKKVLSCMKSLRQKGIQIKATIIN